MKRIDRALWLPIIMSTLAIALIVGQALYRFLS